MLGKCRDEILGDTSKACFYAVIPAVQNASHAKKESARILVANVTMGQTLSDWPTGIHP
jgi:hypothetical protein